MPKDVWYGKTLRKSFAKSVEIQDMPDLLEIQRDSYKWFLETGLREVFKDVAAITDYSGNLELSFIDYKMDDPPKYSVEEAMIMREVDAEGVHMDVLVRRTGLPVEKVNALCMALRLKGRVRFFPGNRVALPREA